MNDLKEYAGDDEFTRLLRKNRCKRTLDFIKASILGAQTSPEHLKIEDVLKNIFKNLYKRKPDSDILRQFLNLWFLIYKSVRFPSAEHIKPDLRVFTKKNLMNYVDRQLEAGEEFLKYIHNGNIDIYRNDQAFYNLYKIYFQNIELLGTIRENMANKWSRREFRSSGSFFKRLENYIRVLWDTKVSMKEYVKNKKIESIKKKGLNSIINDNIYGDIYSELKCSCGSNKKFYECCGRH